MHQVNGNPMLPTSKRIVKGISSAAAATNTSTFAHANRTAVIIASVRSPYASSSSSRMASTLTTEKYGATHAAGGTGINPSYPRAAQGRPSSPSRHYSQSRGPATTPHPKQVPSVIYLPEPPPVLLLTGDELHVTSDGVSRSHYQLQFHTTSGNNNDMRGNVNKQALPSWSIEEEYHLEECRKRFLLREWNLFGASTSCTLVDIQEKDTRQVGTGGTTWEASLAMALYFAQYPKELQGRVVELGSGVGLGGILAHHVTHQQNAMVLTDGNDQVLEQCRANIARRNEAAGERNSDNTLEVQKMDWNDVLREEASVASSPKKQQYNTVLACDCAYRKDGVKALAATLKALLSKTSNDTPKKDNHRNDDPTGVRNKIHLFGPYNRAVYHSLIEVLQKDERLDVHSEWLELNRYRLAAPSSTVNNTANHVRKSLQQHHHVVDATSVFQHPYNAHSLHDDGDAHDVPTYRLDNPTLKQLEDELSDASKSTTKFLHVTASFRTAPPNKTKAAVCLSDID